MHCQSYEMFDRNDLHRRALSFTQPISILEGDERTKFQGKKQTIKVFLKHSLLCLFCALLVQHWSSRNVILDSIFLINFKSYLISLNFCHQCTSNISKKDTDMKPEAIGKEQLIRVA